MKKPPLNPLRVYITALVWCLISTTTNAEKAMAVTPPTIQPGNALCLGNTTVQIYGSGTPTIYYTTDGSIPTTSSHLYSSTFTINETTTVKAISVVGGVSSSVTTVTMTFDPTIQPILLPFSGTAYTSQAILQWLRSDLGVTSSSGLVSTWLSSLGVFGYNAIQSTSSNQPSLVLNALNGYPSIKTGTNKYFTLDSGGAHVNINIPGFFIVMKPNSTSNGALIDFSGTAGNNDLQCSVASPSATFTINQGSTPASLTASSATSVGQYAALGMQSDYSTDPVTQAEIYTNGVLDATGALGTPPSSTVRTLMHVGTDYSTSSNFFDGELLEIIAMYLAPPGNDYIPPQVDPYFLSRYQILTQNPDTPIISMPSGSLSGPTQVGISVPANCVCKYTLDGTTPTSASPTYTEPIDVFYSQTLNAIAIKNGFSSSVASSTYTLDSTQWPAPDPSDTTPLQVNVQSPN